MITSYKTCPQTRFQPGWGNSILDTQPFPVHMCTHHTDAHTESLGFIFWAEGEGWSGRELGWQELEGNGRGPGLGAREQTRGDLRSDMTASCLYFPRPFQLGEGRTDRQTDREEEEKTSRKHTINAGSFFILPSMSTPRRGQCVPQSCLPGVWCLFLALSLSSPVRPPSCSSLSIPRGPNIP